MLDQLDLYRDLLATVLDARLTVASNSLNAIMKRLTAFTVILMVPTLIAGIYGMNFESMPELDWPLGYPFALALMAAAVVVAVTLVPAQRLVLTAGTADASACGHDDPDATERRNPDAARHRSDADPAPTPIDTPQEPEQRAPGADQPPLGAPRDEPDPEI